MDITAVTATLSKEYETRSALRTYIKSTNEDIQQAEKRLKQASNELDFNKVQIGLLEVLIKRPDGVKIEAVKRPSCTCAACNPAQYQADMQNMQAEQEEAKEASDPSAAKEVPATKKRAKR